MFATINISGLSATEKAAQEILEHIEAIRRIQSEAAFKGIRVEVDLKEEAASGN